MQATITSKGQITIPKTVRDRLHLKPGDRIEFILNDDGTVSVVPITVRVTELKGMVPQPKAVISLSEMDDAIAKGATKR
jgi:AbrB family looped-hinge helix DNA binding protein